MNFITEITKPEISLSFESVKVGVETRKLRAVWSPEISQDLDAFHSIDTVAKIEALMVKELAASIDQEIMKDILGGIHYLREISKSVDIWDNLDFPVVKQIMAKTISQDLVEVKPMSAPSGLLFYMDYIGPERKPKYIFLIPEKKHSKNQKVWGIA